MHGDSFRRRENKSFNEETNRSHFVIGKSKVWPHSTLLHVPLLPIAFSPLSDHIKSYIII